MVPINVSIVRVILINLCQEYFETFGEIESVKLKMDPVTGRSRGFAFLLYKDIESVVKAADGSEHQIKVKPGKSKLFLILKPQ